MTFYRVPDNSSASHSITFLSADRGPCMVCGAPSGDCKGDAEYHGQINFIPMKPDDPRATFRVPRRIYEEVEVNGRKRMKLLYAQGAAITPEEAKRIGLLPK